MSTITGVKVVAGLCLWSFFVAGLAKTATPRFRGKAKDRMFVRTKTLSGRPVDTIVLAGLRAGRRPGSAKGGARNRRR